MDPKPLADILASYGGWGLSAVLMVACVVLFHMLIREKDRRLADTRKLNELALDLKRETNKALATIDRLIETLGRRLH